MRGENVRNIVTVANINELKFDALVTLLSEVYTKEIPEIGLNNPIGIAELETLTVFFSNQYAYMTELWGTTLYHVRQLKHMKAPTESIDTEMAKRDFLGKVMSTCKLKADKCSVLLRHHREDK